MCGTYPADKYCGSWPRQPMPARLAFSIGFPPQTPPGWPGPTQEYRMGILVPFIRVLPYSAGTGSLVSSPVLCMVGTGIGTLCEKMRRQKQNFFSKAFRHAIKLDELYCVTKSFRNWSFYLFAHFLSERPPFCFAQAYRTAVLLSWSSAQCLIINYKNVNWRH